MKKESAELEAGALISEILVRELKRLKEQPHLDDKETYTFERLSRVYSTMMDEIRAIIKDPRLAALLQGQPVKGGPAPVQENQSAPSSQQHPDE